MPLTLRWGTVTAVTQRFDELVRCEVDGAPCIAYPRQTGAVEVGDTVLVNTQARDLGLGSGGFDVLYANLTRGLALKPTPSTHVMTLPYTGGQSAPGASRSATRWPTTSRACRSSAPGSTASSRRSWPGSAPASATAYAQLGGGALPVALSDTLRLLKTRQLVETAIAVAPCLDGDVQVVSIASALAWAKEKGFDVVVCGIGPGVVGTGSEYGHGGLALADAANAAVALGGRAIVTVRYSSADLRERHRGVSHHTRSAVRLILGPYEVAWPVGLEPDPSLGPVVEVRSTAGGTRRANLPLSHMGRRRRTTRGSSPPLSRPAGTPGRCSDDRGAAARPGRRARDVRHVRPRRGARRRGRRRARSTPASGSSTRRRCTAARRPRWARLSATGDRRRSWRRRSGRPP